jgi:hypothetical protein
MAVKPKKKFRTAAQFAAGRAPAGGVKYGPFNPQLAQQINRGRVQWQPVANLFKPGAFTGGYAPRGGGVTRGPGGATKVPAGPTGQWWTDPSWDPYTKTYDPMSTLAGQTGPGGKLNIDDLAGLGVQPMPWDIAGTGRSLGAGDIESDWEMQAALADIAGANRADEIGATAAIEALATQWGGDLSGLVKAGKISQKTAEAAKANEFSTMSQLGRHLSQGLGQGYNQLAARGIISSGAMPGLTGELNRQYQQETTTGLQGLMGEIAGIRNRQASAAAERRGNLQGVRSSIANRLAQLPEFQQTPAMKAFWDAEVGAYVDDWGRRYDRNKNRIG